ncbi:MAG: hypothetical protein AAF655_21325 [Bacteroidota bacterium]
MRSIYFLLIWIPASVFSQSDEINISASFAQSIELRITNGANVSWTFTTISQYETGFSPQSRHVDFEVASSINFSVQFEMGPMTNAGGDQLDIGNISLRPCIKLEDIGLIGTRHEFGESTYSVPVNSKGYLAGKVFPANAGVQTLFTPGPNGNAGDFSDNQLAIRIGMGAYGQTQWWGMKTMLEQNITPGTYTGTMTLTAIPQAL